MRGQYPLAAWSGCAGGVRVSGFRFCNDRWQSTTRATCCHWYSNAHWHLHPRWPSGPAGHRAGDKCVSVPYQLHLPPFFYDFASALFTTLAAWSGWAGGQAVDVSVHRPSYQGSYPTLPVPRTVHTAAFCQRGFRATLAGTAELQLILPGCVKRRPAPGDAAVNDLLRAHQACASVVQQRQAGPKPTCVSGHV